VSKKPVDSNITTERRSLLSRYRWLLFFVLAIVFLPSLLTVTGSQKSALNFVHPKLSKAVEFKSAVTHWWAPVQFTEIRMKDLSAEATDNVESAPVMTAASLTTSQPLWKLAMSMGAGAEIVINQPVLNVRVRDGRTNVEDTLTSVFGESDTTDSGPAMPVSITINGGIVRLLSNSPTGSHPSPLFTTISNINGTFSTLDQSKLIPNVIMVADVGAPVSLVSDEDNAVRESGVNPRIAAALDRLAGDGPLMPFSDTDMAVLQSDETQPSLKMQISAATDNPGVQNLVLEVRQLKLAELEPLIQRLIPGTVCVGEVSCRLQAHLLEDGHSDGFAGRLQLLGENVRWRNTAWAAGESLDLETVSAQGAVALAADGLMVNDLKIRSPLLDLSGSGEVMLAAQDAAGADNKPGDVKFSGRIDLARLSQMLPRTLSVAEGVKAESGELQFSCRVQQATADSSQDALLAINQSGFHWQLAAQNSPIKAVRDSKRLTLDSTLRLDAIGSLQSGGPSVSRARITGAFGEITADPIADGFIVSGTVNPDRLWQDVQQLIDIPRPGLTSDVAVEATLRMSDAAIQLTDVSLLSKEIEVKSQQLTVFPNASITQMFQGSISVNGTSPALKTLIAPWHSATWLSDDSTVTAKLGADPAQHMTVQAVIRPIESGRRQPGADDFFFVIDQGRVDLNLVADSKTGHSLVERGLVEIAGLTANVSGSLGVNSGLLVVSLDADTEYDLDKLTARLLTDPERKIQLTGVRRDVFHLEGCPNLWNETDVARYLSTSGATTNSDSNRLKPLKATGRVSWDGGRLYGLALGEGGVVVELHNGLLRTEPIRCELGTGEVNVMPQWDMNTNFVQLASGSRIQNLQVTPELSGEWLGFLAPMMAEAANVQGTVSARVQQFDYYMDSPSTSTIVGQLSLLNTSASPGQSIGPLIQVLDLVDRSDAGQSRDLVFPNQDIPFELRNGMVLHDGLQVGFGKYMLSSRGGVGLDKRVQLVLTVPLEANAAGRTLEIPVGGTVDRPQLDTSGLLQNLGRQQIQNQVDKQLNGGLNKLLDKFR
jgi:hypothetical protein